MKKYIKLKAGERVIKDDEYFYGTKWEDMSHEEGYIVQPADEGYVRRPVPLSGEQRFLVSVSVTVPVRFDCTGMDSDLVDATAASAAIHALASHPDHYLSPASIDWGKSCVDESFVPDNTVFGPHNNWGESMDYGVTGYWMPFQKEDGFRIERIDEPVDHDPLDSDETAWRLAKMVGYKLDANGYVLSFPDDRYRPFEKGEMIEMGDQLRFSPDNKWRNCGVSIGGVIEDDSLSIFRKLKI